MNWWVDYLIRTVCCVDVYFKGINFFMSDRARLLFRENWRPKQGKQSESKHSGWSWSVCEVLWYDVRDWSSLGQDCANLFVTAGRRIRMHLVIKRLHERLGLGFDVLRKKEKCTVIRSPWEDKQNWIPEVYWASIDIDRAIDFMRNVNCESPDDVFHEKTGRHFCDLWRGFFGSQQSLVTFYMLHTTSRFWFFSALSTIFGTGFIVSV